jgi:hypothetical protein
MKLYQNANISDGDSFSTDTDRPKVQQQTNEEDEDNYDNISYESQPVVESGQNTGIPLEFHPCMYTDLQCLWH